MNKFLRKFKKSFFLLSDLLILFKNNIRHLSYKKYLPADARQDDVYLVEFPKSGVTWLSFILSNIYIRLENKNEKEFVTFYNLTKYVYELDALFNKAFMSKSVEKRFIKSHSLYNPFYLMVIYLLRNPFDVMVSYYNYMSDQGWNGSFIKFVKSKEHGIYAWKNHVNNWLLNTEIFYSNTIHLLKYEDLLRDTFTEIKSIFYNLGLNISDDIIKNAIYDSSLENMKKSEEFYRRHSFNYKVSFVGKKNKIPKEELLTSEIKDFILIETGDILEKFYPELINKNCIDIIGKEKE